MNTNESRSQLGEHLTFHGYHLDSSTAKASHDSSFRAVIFCLTLFALGMLIAAYKYLHLLWLRIYDVITNFSGGEHPAGHRCASTLDSSAREERAIQAVTPDPIPAAKFISVYKQRLKSRQLDTEFKALTRNQEDHPSQAALRNVLLNNKQDVVPCDHSRVIVWEGYDVTGSDYYNASYIDGYNGPKEYIASQGPSTKRFASFWHMIWQEGVSCVVMATGLFENSVQQCDKYWVDHSRKHAQYGKIHVWHEKSTYLAQLNIRTFRLQKEGSYDSRLLTHYEMVGLHEECPSSGLLLDVRRRVNALSTQSLGPVLVHCRCGGGRSAVYLAVEYCLQKLQAEDRVDVYSTVLHLRRFRKNMVKSVQQYQQIYEAVAMYIRCGVTVYPKHLLPDAYRVHYARRGESKSHRLEREYQSLHTIVPRLSIGDCASGHRVENRSKSRDIMMLPPERARPYLTTADCGDGGTDFINAVYIDGYHAENSYLVTQWPMKRTIADFWRLFFDFKITSFVVMNEVVKFSRSYPRFWPKEINQVATYGPISVRYISCSRRPDLVIRTFAVRKPKRHPHLIAQALVRISEDVMIMNNLVGCELRRDEFIVKMFQVVAGSSSHSSSLKRKNIRQSYQNRQFKVDLNSDEQRRGSYDMDDVPMNYYDDDHDKKSSGVGLQSRSLLSVMDHVEDWQKRSGSRQSVCIVSKDGCSRVGLYCTISICCDQLKTEKEVDVFNAVRYVRVNRPQLLPTLEEYRYVYHFMTEYILLSKNRPDIVITQPASSIFTRPEFEKSANTLAIIANSLHGGVYIRNEPALANSRNPQTEKSETKHEKETSQFAQPERLVPSACNLKEDHDQQQDWETPLSSDNSHRSLTVKTNSRSKEKTLRETVNGTLPQSYSHDYPAVDSDWASSHSEICSNCDVVISQMPPSSQADNLAPSSLEQPLSAASLLTKVNCHGENHKERKPETCMWPNRVNNSPTLSYNIPTSPCASKTAPTPTKSAGILCGHSAELSETPMQRVFHPPLPKCFLSPGTYAHGYQGNKASCSSLCTNSSFHSCHSNLGDAFPRTAGSPKLPHPDHHSGSSGGVTLLSNGFYPSSDNMGSYRNRCVSFTSLSTDVSGIQQAGINQVTAPSSPLSLTTGVDGTMVHASYASLEDSVVDSLEDHYSSLDWAEHNNNAHIVKQGHQADGTLKKEKFVRRVSMRNSLFPRSKVIPWPSPLSLVKKVKEFKLNRKERLIRDS